MTDVFAPIRSAVEISVPAEHRKPLAVVGAGSIVDVAHLPAYRELGLEVHGIFDLAEDRARSVAAAHGIPRVYASLDELAADGAVEVVDVAVFPWTQPAVAAQLLDAGKHLLCQKPLALSVPEATGIADHADACDRIVAVNQQLRFDEGIAAAKAMLDLGWIGEPTAVTFDVHVYTPWETWPWVAAQEHLDLKFHTIHYLDAVRYLIGDPLTVWGTQARIPGQSEQGEMRSISVLTYAGELRALLHIFHRNVDGDPHATFRIDGTLGSIRGTLGLLYDYPTGRPDTLELFSRVLPTDGWLPYPITTRWVPDAFRGPIASVLTAVAGGSAPPTAARENLGTLRMIDALYVSNESGSAQPL